MRSRVKKSALPHGFALASSVIAINLALRPLAAYSRKHQRCVDYTYIHADYFIMCDRNLESRHCRRLTPPKQVMGGEFRASYLFVQLV
jgi:hypothetical protein